MSENGKNANRNSTFVREYIWLGNRPLAQLESKIKPNGTTRKAKISYLHVDHLNTPRKASDENGDIVWAWNSDAFGAGKPDRDVDGDGQKTNIRLRFPGQYADAESGLFYNNQRDYDPKLGRYIQSDPIGLNGGINRYGYVGGNPVGFVDPSGLVSVNGSNWCKGPLNADHCTVGPGDTGGGEIVVEGIYQIDNGGAGVSGGGASYDEYGDKRYGYGGGPTKCAGHCTPSGPILPPNKRPCSAAFEDKYLNYQNYGKDEAWATIGGTLGAAMSNQNSCAARLSCGLNGSGAAIGSVPGASNLTYGGPNDGLRFIISARELRNYIIMNWGQPDFTNYTLNDIRHQLKAGQVAIYSADWHAGVVTQASNDNYTDYGDYWLLPVCNAE